MVVNGWPALVLYPELSFVSHRLTMPPILVLKSFPLLTRLRVPIGSLFEAVLRETFHVFPFLCVQCTCCIITQRLDLRKRHDMSRTPESGQEENPFTRLTVRAPRVVQKQRLISCEFASVGQCCCGTPCRWWMGLMTPSPFSKVQICVTSSWFNS